MTEKLLNKAEAAKFLRLSVKTLDTLRRKKEIPWFHVGRSVRFRESDIHKCFDAVLKTKKI